MGEKNLCLLGCNIIVLSCTYCEDVARYYYYCYKNTATLSTCASVELNSAKEEKKKTLNTGSLSFCEKSNKKKKK